MKRVQRKRTKGFQLPPNTRCVNRGTMFGNPHRVEKCSDGYSVRMDSGSLFGPFTDKRSANQCAVDAFRRTLRGLPPDRLREMIAELAQYDYIACFCSLDAPCHGDVWIELVDEYKGTKQ